MGVSVAGIMLACVLAAPLEAQRVSPPSVVDEARARRALEDRIARDPAMALPYLELARFELQAGDPHRAELVLRTGLVEAAGDPARSDVRRGLVELLGVGERWAEALEVIEGAPERESQGWSSLRARLLVATARDLRQAGRAEQAEEALQMATAADPSVREAWVELTALLLSGGRIDDAGRTAERGLHAHAGDAELMLLRASTMDGQARIGATAEALRALRADRPDDVRVAVSLAGHLAATGDPSAALALQDTLLAVPAPDAIVFDHVGTFWLTVGDADSASVHLERGVGLHDGSAGLWALLGWAYEESGRDEAAAEAYRSAAARSEVPTWLRLRAARTAITSGDLRSARADLLTLSEVDAPLVAALIAAELAETHGEVETASGILRRAALRWQHDPWLKEAEARVALTVGDTVLATGRYGELARAGSLRALVALRRLPEHDAVARDRDVVRSSVRAGIERIAKSEEELAGAQAPSSMSAEVLTSGADLGARWQRDLLDDDRALLEQVVDEVVFETEWGPAELGRLRGMYPGSVFLTRVDVRLALANGNLERARMEVERLLRLQPGHGDTHALHGRVLEAMGIPDRARVSYGRSFELAPDAPEAFEALVRIHRSEDSLADLLDRVRRLRAISPDSATLLGHEIELLHRLGRLDEARALTGTDEGGVI